MTRVEMTPVQEMRSGPDREINSRLLSELLSGLDRQITGQLVSKLERLLFNMNMPATSISQVGTRDKLIEMILAHLSSQPAQPATINDLPSDTIDTTFHGRGRVSVTPAGLNMSGHQLPERWCLNETQCAHDGVANALASPLGASMMGYRMPVGPSSDQSQPFHGRVTNHMGSRYESQRSIDAVSNASVPQRTAASPGLSMTSDVSQVFHRVPSNSLGPQGTRASPGLNAGYGTPAGLSSNNHQLFHHAVSNLLGPQGTRTSPGLSMESETRVQADDTRHECKQSNPNWTKKVQRDPVMQQAREIAKAGGGLSGFATVMIQQIPYEYLQSELMIEINNAGFEGTFDFIFLPMCQKRHGNIGFAFVNFLSPIFAERFYRRYHHQKLDCFDATLTVNVLPADVQGFEQSVAHFYSSWHRRKRKRHPAPIVLRPLPEHLREEGCFEGNSRASVAYEASSSSQKPSHPSARLQSVNSNHMCSSSSRPFNMTGMQALLRLSL